MVPVCVHVGVGVEGRIEWVVLPCASTCWWCGRENGVNAYVHVIRLGWCLCVGGGACVGIAVKGGVSSG